MSAVWVGMRWAGDTRYGHCSVCGNPASATDDDNWWHCYAIHIVECRDESQAFVEEGRFP